MGWGSGSSLFRIVIEAAKRAIDDRVARREFYLTVLSEFNQHDWDTQDECTGEDDVFDQILREQGYTEDEG
jgi:N-acetylglucosamine kinase-like BadF-type ATPase